VQVLAAATILCFLPTLATDLVGIGLFVLVYLGQRHRLLRKGTGAEVPSQAAVVK
jgi:hypothetical protein